MPESLFDAACRVIPGGVNSPVRAFAAVGGTPVFIARGEGPWLFDSNGKKYIDYVGSWGPMILGHAHPQVLAAVHGAIDNGLSFGAPTEIETQVAEKICELMPNIDQVRMVNSGTEATMSAIRLARGFTGRDKLVKFEGCYHGHADGLLVKAGSGAATIGVPTSPGIPEQTARDTITLPYNDAETLEVIFETEGHNIAAVIIEAITGNMNMLFPQPGYLETLRALCDRFGTLLIFDEVMTGFRVALGGAQQHSGIRPDLTCLGKVIGGGMPVGAYGGRREIMQKIAPAGPVYQAGTLSGNPVAMAAGLATLELISEPGFFDRLSASTNRLSNGLREMAGDSGIPFSSVSLGGMFGFVFSEREPINFDDVVDADQDLFRKFFHAMLERGIYLAPSAFEAGFVSAAHSDAVIDETLEKVQDAFRSLR